MTSLSPDLHANASTFARTFLVTKRLALCPLSDKDFAMFYHLRSHPQLRKRISSGVQNRFHARRDFDAYQSHWQRHGFGVGLVYAKEETSATPKCIGYAGLTQEEAGTCRLSYGYVPCVWGKGYATEMAQALVDWAFEGAAMQKVTATAMGKNHLSCRVLEKCGLAQVGTHTKHGKPVRLYEKDRAEAALPQPLTLAG